MAQHDGGRIIDIVWQPGPDRPWLSVGPAHDWRDHHRVHGVAIGAGHWRVDVRLPARVW